MQRNLVGMVVLCGLVSLGLAATAIANSAVDGDEPAMMVSPSTIVLAKVDTITVHTNIIAVEVKSGSITLDGVEPTGTGVDNCGHLVAKFAVDDLDLEPGKAALTLDGAFKDGGDFSATDEVMVK